MDLTLFNALAYLEKPDGLIALPGPENYVLAVRPENPDALSRLYRLKGKGEPLLLLGWDQQAFLPYLAPLPSQATVLMKRYWPRPLILMVDKNPQLSEAFTSHPQLKLLQPASGSVLDLLSLNPGGLLATLCANRPGDAPARNAQAVLNSFGDDVDLMLENDAALAENEAPTVVSIEASGRLHLLRSGGIVLD